MSRTPALSEIVPKKPAAGVSVTTPEVGFRVTVTFAGAATNPASRTLKVSESPSVSVLGRVNETGEPATDVWLTIAPRNGRLLRVFALPVSTAVTTAGVAEPSFDVTVRVVVLEAAKPALGVTLTTALAVSVTTVAAVIVTGLTGRSPLSGVLRTLA